MLDPPLRFRIRPGVLRVRIARQHPGASPSAIGARGPVGGLVELARIAVGRAPTPATPTRRRPAMDLMEITREGATEPRGGRRPPARARRHARPSQRVEFDRGGMHFKVHVPDEVDFKLEIEIDDDERELEIEINW